MAVILTLSMPSCRSSKTTAAIERSSAQTYTDTTRTEISSRVRSEAAIDTTKTAAAFEGNNVIEFVEGGGKINIAPDGNVTLEGVKNMRGQHKGSVLQENGVSQEAEDATTHNEQANGINSNQDEHENLTEEKAPSQKWYEIALARLGLGVCIAALLWVLFLYLRRKY